MKSNRVALYMSMFLTVGSSIYPMCGYSVPAGEVIELVRPMIGFKSNSAQSAGREVISPRESFIKRQGDVNMSVSSLMQMKEADGRLNRQSVTSDSLVDKIIKVGLFDNAAFTVKIETESRPRPDLVSVTGRVIGEDMSTFTLTVSEESYLMSVDNAKANIRYMVKGDPETGNGIVTEINLYELPRTIDLPPIPVPKKSAAH